MSGEQYLVCKLKKNLYGLKQVPRQWYLKFDRFMASNGYRRLKIDHYCYFKYFENSYIILLMYIDDMLVARSSMREIVNLKTQFAREFSIKDLGITKKILGIRIRRERKKTVEAITS